MKNFPKDANWSVMISTANNGVLVSLCDPLSNVIRIDVINEKDLFDRYSSNSLLQIVLNQYQFATEQEAEEALESQALVPEAAPAEDDDIQF